MWIITSFKLASPQLFKQMGQAGSMQFLPFAGTVLAILLTDLLGSVPIALGLSVVFVLRSNLRRPLRRQESAANGASCHPCQREGSWRFVCLSHCPTEVCWRIQRLVRSG